MNLRHRYITVSSIILIVIILSLILLLNIQSVQAADGLTIEIITWDIIGLDSNDINTGPDHFPVGARICDTLGTGDISPVTVTFALGTGDAPIAIVGSPSQTGVTVPSGGCYDAYFEVVLTRDDTAYDKTKDYTITVTSPSSPPNLVEAGHELFVEHLISQNRNSVTNVAYALGASPASLTNVAAGGEMNLTVGNTYTIELTGGTATQGYEQFEEFITLTNTVFQILSVTTDYAVSTAPASRVPDLDNHPQLYADACGWDSDPNSPTYRACLGSGKTGGSPVVTTYVVTIISGGGTQQTLNSLLYDFSGSSFHYNADYDVGVRFANILDPDLSSIAKNFAPATISTGGTSTLTFTLGNTNTGALSGYNFTDTLPTNLDFANTATALSGCGSGIASIDVTLKTLTFAGGTVAASGSCIITTTVTSDDLLDPYTNNTTNLLIDTHDTLKMATAQLVVIDTVVLPTCTAGTLASWDFEGGTTAATFQDSQVGTADATLVGGTSSIDTTEGSPSGAGSSWSGTGWEVKNVIPSPTAATESYFEFAIDTSNVTGNVTFTFDVNFNGRWAGSATNILYIHTDVDGGGYSTLIYPNATNTQLTKNAWETGLTTTTSTDGNLTTFRINAEGLNAPNLLDEPLLIDNVAIAGCINTPDVPTLDKSFVDPIVAVGATSTLTFTLGNPNSTVLIGAAFTDTLPTGLTASNFVNNCTGGTWEINSGVLSLSGATIPAAGCTVTVDIVGSAAGPYNNISDYISATDSGTNTTTDGFGTASLTVVAPPVISKQFAANPILANGVSTLTFTITNPNPTDASAVAFTDTFPTTPGAMVVSGLQTGSVCGGGTLTAADGAASIGLAGGSISANSSCTFSVNITAPTADTNPYSNESGTVSYTVSTLSIDGNTAIDDLVVNAPNPDINIRKQVGLGSSISGLWFPYLTVTTGTDIYYLFIIENTGDVDLTAVTVIDTVTGTPYQTDIDNCDWQVLAPAAATFSDHLTMPASLPVAEASDNEHIAYCVIGPYTAVDGTIDNTATVQGTYMGTQYPGTPASSQATYATGALTLTKLASPTTYTTAGQTITYTFSVENTGAATLNGPVTIADTPLGAVSCPVLSTIGDLDDYFDVGETIVCSTTYSTTAGDVSAGSKLNTATASAIANSGTVTSPPSPVTITVPRPDLIVVKANSVSGSVLVNTAWDWTLTITNNGTADAVFTSGQTVITDQLPTSNIAYGSATGSGLTCNIVTGLMTCTVTAPGPVTIANGGGTLVITIPVTGATAGGTYTNPTGGTCSVDPGTLVTESDDGNNACNSDAVTVEAPSLSVTKTPATQAILTGGTATFTITAQNTGNVNLTSVTLVDDPVCTSVSGPTGDIGIINTLEPAETWTYTCYVSGVTLGFTNIATVTGIPPTGSNVSDNASAAVTVEAALLTIVKTGTLNDDGNGIAEVGETISYSFLVTNTGTVSLNNVVVTDNTIASGSIICPTSGDNTIDPLVVSGTETCNATYILVQADIDAGTHTNTATADSDETNPVTDDETVSLPATLRVVKELTNNADGDASGDVSLGDTLTYTITATNAGTSALTNVIVSDDLTGDSITCTTVASSATCVLTVTYVVTQANVDAGQIVNTGTADSNETPPVTDPHTEPINTPPPVLPPVQQPSAVPGPVHIDPHVSKTANPPFAIPGEIVTFTFTISNPNNVAITNINVFDPIPPEVEIISATLVQGDGLLTVNGQNVSYADPIMNVGETATVSIVTRVRGTVQVPFQITNVVYAGSNTAEATVISISALPETGVSPWWRSYLIGFTLIIIFIIVMRVIWSRRKPQSR